MKRRTILKAGLLAALTSVTTGPGLAAQAPSARPVRREAPARPLGRETGACLEARLRGLGLV